MPGPSSPWRLQGTCPIPGVPTRRPVRVAAGGQRAPDARRLGGPARALRPGPSPDERVRGGLSRSGETPQDPQALRPFGPPPTERGLWSARSPGDLVLAPSDSKIEAACRILAA